MFLQAIWRYPVKSMAGEPLERGDLRMEGMAGDRTLQVRDARGRTITSRTRPQLLGHKAVTKEDGQITVDGLPWDSPEVTAAVKQAAGEGARIVSVEAKERFDILPLLVITDGAIEAFGHDFRRLRPNLVIGGVDGLTERDWEGRRLRIGAAVVELADLRGRCVMTTFHPDTLHHDPAILQQIYQNFEGKLGLNASVMQPGPITVGDTVELLS